jgi:hypothetical protein
MVYPTGCLAPDRGYRGCAGPYPTDRIAFQGLPSQADSRNLRPCARPPTGARVVRVRDVAIIPTQTDEATDEDYARHPPAEGADLGRSLTIERLSDDDYNLVMAACRPRGHFFIGVPQWGQRYTFVRDIDLANYEANPYGWDEDRTLSYSLALSRLVRDTVHCTEFAGRIVDHGDGQQQVIPLDDFNARVAYRYGRDRDWLDEVEAAELAALLERFWQVEPDWPPRVRRAIQHCERASQTPFFLESQPRIVTGLEAVLNSHPSHVTKQFRERVVAVADDLGIPNVSKRFADRMYEARSQAYHGEDVRLFSGHPGAAAPVLTDRQQQAIDQAKRLQLILRSLVRKAIEDHAFRNLLADVAAVRARWPVRIRLRRPWWRVTSV